MRHPDRRLTPNLANVTAKVIDGEAIILDITRGAYYSMDGAGAIIWELLEGGSSQREVVEALKECYGVSPDEVEAEVERLAEELLLEELLLPAAPESTVPRVPAPAAAGRDEPFRSPTLHKHTDMTELLALDPPNPMPVLGEIIEDGP